jgi:hypothetical protein
MVEHDTRRLPETLVDTLGLPFVSSIETLPCGVRNTFLEFYDDCCTSAPIGLSRRRAASFPPAWPSIEERKMEAIALAQAHVSSLLGQAGGDASNLQDGGDASNLHDEDGTAANSCSSISPNAALAWETLGELVSTSDNSTASFSSTTLSPAANGMGDATTVMIRNIACRYNHKDVKRVLDDAGMKGSYNFVHLPLNQSRRANLGYVFVDFKSPQHVDECRSTFDGCVFGTSYTTKTCQVSLANTQGKPKIPRHGTLLFSE